MAFQFPQNPTEGEVYQGYAWRGSYWSRISAEPSESAETCGVTSVEETPTVPDTDREVGVSAPSGSQPITGSNNTLINLTIPIDLGQLLHNAGHAHSDFDYIAPE